MSSLVRSTAIMSVGTVLSRVTGLLRIAAIAAALGFVENRLADAYNYANTAPNIIYELVLGGILTSVFVPVFVELLEKEGRDAAWGVASAIINWSLIALVGMAAIGVLAAPYIAGFYTSRLGEGAQAQAETITFLLRVFIPQIIFYGLAAMTAGLLNAHRRFGPPMFTPVLNNLTVIAVFVLFHQAYPTVGELSAPTTRQLLIIGIGTTAGVALMAFAQIPFLRGLGRYRPTLSIAHPSVKKLARLSVFVIGYVIVNQIGYLVVQWLAGENQGAYSSYLGAFTFFMLPHGLFAVSIITALLPGMSQAAANQEIDAFRERLSTGIRTTALLIFPAAVGYFVLGDRIVTFMLERGIMTAESSDLVAGVLQFFTLGLLPFSLFQLMLRAFYALQDTRTPFLINVAAVGLNTAINVPMYMWLGVRGLAAGHALAYLFGAALQARALARRIGGLGARRLAASIGRIAVAAGAMGLLVWGTASLLGGFAGESFAAQTVTLLGAVGVGAASYLLLAHVLGIEELAYVRGLLTRASSAGAASPRPPGE